MAKKIKVAVLMGGKSPEHEISLMSGREVVSHLDPKKYEILPVIISKDGSSWQLTSPAKLLNSKRDSVILRRKPKNLETLRYAQSDNREVQDDNSYHVLKDNGIDIIFIAMHGPYGENGTIQGFLELLGIPYTGSGVLASALAMNKLKSRKIFEAEGLNVPKTVVLKKGDGLDAVWEKLKPPVFVKPNSQGSSVGTFRVNNKKDLEKSVRLALKLDTVCLVEEYLPGIEITCTVLGNDKPKALPLVEIVTKRDFFDYKAKYTENLTDEIVPARISKILSEKATEAAIKSYLALGCRDFARVDIIIKENKVYILELNTIPGLTPVSLFPKAAKAAGITYGRLIDKIIELALKRYDSQKL
ncbi:MAG: D-alanine--D-alanine ligase [Candidatus Curtissbacteria bacterium]|nr:D-alanine--D-alanine ligase [Candidatus Curtissbacteria bacterium]